MVEITQRTLQGRSFLKPSPKVNELVVGCLAKAQKHTAAQVHAVAVMSNHFHCLASFDTVEQMAGFVGHFKGNLSKELGRIHDWEGPMWAGRYKSIPVSDEPEAQISRLRYLLSQGCKEGLVLSPLDWPGVHSAKALKADQPLKGIWIDRTRLFAARRKNPRAKLEEVTSREELLFSPLPCWRELDPSARRREAAGMIEDIEKETFAMHQREGTTPAGIEAVNRRSPLEKTPMLKKSPPPRFHAATKRVREILMEAYREFFASYREAAARLAAGDPAASFPENCYPPALPFVPPGPFSH